MPGLLQNIASAFDKDDAPSTSLVDVTDLAARLGAPLFQQVASKSAVAAIGGGMVSVKAGTLYVHSKRTDVPLPSFPPLSKSGVPAVDSAFEHRSTQLQHEMAREFSDFSLAGLAWADAVTQNSEKIAAERAAEDAALAKRRMEEDAAIAARRANEDGDRAQHDGVTVGAFRTKREEEEAALLARWKTKFAELNASLEEAVAAHEQRKALEEQRLKEEQARAQEKAARDAALAAERAMRNTELAEDARRLAEMATLRLATSPSVRSLILVSAEHIAPALGYACPIAGTPLRTADRSWWKALHLLEAEGLTPPLKATDLAQSLFTACDEDADGAVPCSDAGFLLGLLTSGTARDRVDAACDAPGSPANGLTVTQPTALRQLQLCARVRKHCAPKITALLLHVTAADATTMQPVPAPDVIERSLSTFFAGAPNMPSDKFRAWAATARDVAVLFAPLSN